MRSLAGWFVLAALAACTEHGRGGPVPGSDADPCGDLGCASGPGTLTLTVIDGGTGQPILGSPETRDLTFTANGDALPFTCSAVVQPGTACPSWQLSIVGMFDIEIAAPGHLPETITALIQGPEGCCGIGPSTTASVTLKPDTI